MVPAKADESDETDDAVGDETGHPGLSTRTNVAHLVFVIQ